MRHSVIIALALVLQTSLAEEYTVAPKPFKTETALEAVFLPSQSHGISVAPKEWSDFVITSLVEQGSKVKKGDVLIGIETSDLDKAISKEEESISLGRLKLAQNQRELGQLKITTPRALETHARQEKESAVDLEWYRSIEQARETEQAKQNVIRAEFYLSAAKEELAQLLKMYNEDNKTEETEEIILKRARHHVAHCEFALKSAKINAERQLNTIIPRTLKTKELAAQEARIAHADAKLRLPKTLQIKTAEVDKASREHEESIQKLADLKADRAMMKITAPCDGIVYYGEIKNGAWNSAAATKALKIGGKLPAHSTLLSIIPSDATLALHAATAENKTGNLDQGARGYATTLSAPYRNIPVSITSLATHPHTDGTFHTILEPSLTEGVQISPGMKANVRIITNRADQALKIPVDYLSNTDDGGHSIQLKLADGKTAERKVTIGKSNEQWAVITEGLEPGQVIVK